MECVPDLQNIQLILRASAHESHVKQKSPPRLSRISQWESQNEMSSKDVGNLRARRFDKFSKQIPSGLLIRQPFRVPLHSKTKRMVRQFDRFDQSIWCVTCDAKGRRDLFKSLMVKAIHLDNWLTVNFSDVRPLFDFDFMYKDGPFVARIIMIKCVEKLIRDVSIESSS